MKTYLCIGGSRNEQYLTSEEATALGYVQYNCADSYNRTKLALKRAKQCGRVIPVSCVWI